MKRDKILPVRAEAEPGLPQFDSGWRDGAVKYSLYHGILLSKRMMRVFPQVFDKIQYLVSF